MDVLALTAAGASASVLGAMISFGRLVRRIKGEGKLAQKLAEWFTDPAFNLSEFNTYDFDRIKGLIGKISHEQLTEWEHKQVQRALEQPSREGQYEYLLNLCREAGKTGERAKRTAALIKQRVLALKVYEESRRFVEGTLEVTNQVIEESRKETAKWYDKVLRAPRKDRKVSRRQR